MLLVLHISIAFTSIIQASVALIFPSRTKLTITQGLTAATLLSGIYLVSRTHAPLVSSCFSGLLYLGVISAVAGVARYRLAKQTI